VILFLNDIAGSEILLILVFILIFFGSKSIPGLARTMGRTMRQIKDATADLQTEIKKSSNEMKKDLNLQGILRETEEDIRRPLDQMAVDLDNAVKYQPIKNSHLSKTVVIEEATVREDVNIENNNVETSNDLDSTFEAEPKPVGKKVESKD